MTTEEPELPITDMTKLAGEADLLFIQKTMEAGMLPVMIRKFLLIPSGPDQFSLSMGAAGVFGAKTQEGLDEIPQTPFAQIAFCAAVNRQTLLELKGQIERTLAMVEKAPGIFVEGEGEKT